MPHLIDKVEYWKTEKYVWELKLPVDTQLALLRTEIALRAYSLEKGKLPRTLSKLVGTYLSQLPVDPYSREPLVYYRRRDKKYVLYSVGPNGRDDGGLPHSGEAGDVYLMEPNIYRPSARRYSR